MSRLAIFFFSEEVPYVLKKKTCIRTWLHQVIVKERYKLNCLNFIFCNDTYLLAINQKYLQHDTYTDIITFDHSNGGGEILGDIFISVERVKENAQNFKVSATHEMRRMLIHGTLHLLGYRDKSKTDKLKMTQKEDEYLDLIDF